MVHQTGTRSAHLGPFCAKEMNGLAPFTRVFKVTAVGVKSQEDPID